MTVLVGNFFVGCTLLTRFHMLNQGKETGNEERDRVEWSVCTKMEISPTKDPPLCCYGSSTVHSLSEEAQFHQAVSWVKSTVNSKRLPISEESLENNNKRDKKGGWGRRVEFPSPKILAF